ncbi:MAG: tyrosine protein kinase [Lactobacillales bacterium]|jgi:capsular polysaccharide biosynthesis protein|nr:tyrosine protein kinase [Lactobacillales bacterium]
MDESFVSLVDIVQILIKRLKLLIIFTLLGGLLAGGLTYFFIQKQYSSSAQLIVLNQSDQLSANNLSDLNANVMMINTYKDIVKSKTILGEVKDEMLKDEGYQTSVGELTNQIQVTQNQNSQVFSVSITTPDPHRSQEIVDLVTKKFSEKVTEYLKVQKVSVLSPASLNTSPSSPNIHMNLLIGLVIGLILGVMLVLLLEITDDTVKDENFIINEMGVNVLGGVRNFDKKSLGLTSQCDFITAKGGRPNG